MSSAKKEARLSGMLLARKGAAQPAHTDHRLTVQAVDHETLKPEDMERYCEIEPAQNDHSILVEAVKEINNVTRRQYNNVVESTKEAETIVKKAEVKKAEVREPEAKKPEVQKTEINKADKEDIVKKPVTAQTKNRAPVAKTAAKGKRIAMTLRMENDDHLKLRLYAAHSRKSCQEIISEALEMYLSEDEKVCGLSDCNCLNN